MRIIARLNVGGPALHCLLLSKSLASRGFETVLVTGQPEPGEESFETLFGIRAEGFRLVRLHRLRRMVSLLGDLRSFFQILFLMIRERPDIVHTHTAKAGVLGRMAAILARVPVRLHTFHGHVLSGYFSPFVSKLVCWVERQLAKHSSAIITLSPALKKELSEKFRVAPKEKIHLVPLGRELDEFFENSRLKGNLRTELAVGASTVLIGIVGRLVPIKDHDTLLLALHALPKELDWMLLIVGRGPLETSLREQAASLGLTKKVRFLGWRSDLPSLYAGLDLGVLTSRNEGTPLSIIEAFASGCPVVATAVGGVPDLFAPGTQPRGALVPPGDREALTKALEIFIREPSTRLACGEAAREAAKQFTAEALTDRLDGLYQELLAASV